MLGYLTQNARLKARASDLRSDWVKLAVLTHVENCAWRATWRQITRLARQTGFPELPTLESRHYESARLAHLRQLDNARASAVAKKLADKGVATVVERC
jgi:hypothetical protein